jgi:hypothetical protein
MPFVSQAALDAMQVHLDRARSDLSESREEVRRLTDIIVGMKRQNYQPADAPMPPPQIIPPSPVELAVRKNIPARSRQHIYGEIARWRLEGKSDDQIIHLLEVGEEGAA